jgi:hypothetical protein
LRINVGGCGDLRFAGPKTANHALFPRELQRLKPQILRRFVSWLNPRPTKLW